MFLALLWGAILGSIALKNVIDVNEVYGLIFPVLLVFMLGIWDDLAALKVLNPKIGYLNKAAQVFCTSKGHIYKIGPWDKAKRSPAWTKVGDISASAGVPNLVVCLIDGCFQEVIAHHLTTVQLNHISVADVASFLCSLPALPQGR